MGKGKGKIIKVKYMYSNDEEVLKMEKPITPDPIMRMMNGLWLTQTLTVSVELEIYTKIAKGMNTIEKIAESLNAEHRPIEALLNACVALELLEKDKNIYKNTKVSDTFLVKGRPTYYGDFVEMLSKRSFNTWKTLKESILANYPNEETLEEAFQRDPDFGVLFTKAMHNNAVAPASNLTSLIDFSPYKKVLDLGGGSGIYSIMLAKKYPQIEAIVFDFLSVCTIAQGYIENFGVTSQVRTMGGDFFKTELPKDVDVVVLGQVLHSYSLEECKKIIDISNQVLIKGGLIIIIDFYLNNDKTGPLYPALFALNMIAGSKAGNAYTFNEVSDLLKVANFRDIEIKPLTGPSSLIMAKKG